MITPTRQLENYLERFSEFEKFVAGHALPWLRKLRRDAFARFCEVGFPTTHDEDWRFTNVSAIAQAPFRLARNGPARPSQQELEPYRVAGAACQLVFVNGRFARELSLPGKLPDEVSVGSLAGEISDNPSAIEPHLGRYLDNRRDAFCALNTAFLEDGAYVHIPRGTLVEQPICLLFVSTGDDAPSMSHPRNLVVADEDSQATIVEDYVSLDGGAVFCNTVTELVAGDGGECLINGLFIGNGHQHVDNYMLVEHSSPRCGSRQFYNGILDGHAHGVFHGRIIVHKDAQKTDAKQTNRNLLLSDDAQIDTKPQLEIYADDVKCTHGATIGQIEGDALFYLRSRGIDEVSARKLLLFAFASECLDRMKPGPVRKHVERLINRCLLHMAISAQGAPTGKRREDVARNWEEIG